MLAHDLQNDENFLMSNVKVNISNPEKSPFKTLYHNSIIADIFFSSLRGELQDMFISNRKCHGHKESCKTYSNWP